MQNLRFSTALAASILLAPISAAMGQSTNIAYASAPRSEFVVFFDRTATRMPFASRERTMRLSMLAIVGSKDSPRATMTVLL